MFIWTLNISWIFIYLLCVFQMFLYNIDRQLFFIFMQAHSGLPKNLPQRRNKAKIFSPNISPAKNTKSPARTDQGSVSNSKTPRKSSPSSESQHRLDSKQKPNMKPPRGVQNKNKIMTKQFNHQQVETPQPRQTQFMQTMLGFVENLAKKTSDTQVNAEVRALRPKNQQAKQKSGSKPHKSGPIGPLLYKPRPMHHPGEPSDEELLSRCALMLQDSKNWQNYYGQQKQNMRTGYGILYLKNKDKFMGGFKQNKAFGHGTYYFTDINKRVMAIWYNNEIVFSSGYMMEKIESN